MKKTSKIVVLAIIIFSIIFANNFVKAASSEYGKVTNLSNADVDINGSETAEVTLKYSRLDLTWYKADPSIGRTVDGYWVGYRIDFPEALGGENANETDVQKAKYRGRFPDREWSEAKSFYDARDGKWFLTGWVQITQERLDANEEEFELFEAEFDWKGDGTYEQNIKIKIDPEKVSLDTSNVTTVTIKESGNGASDEVRRFSIETGRSLNEGLIQSELETLESIRNEEGFVKFYKEGEEDKEFSFDEEINETEITIIALFDKPEPPTTSPEPEPPTTSPEPEQPTTSPEPMITPIDENRVQDETPKTGYSLVNKYAVVIVMSVLVVSVIAISGLRKKE